MASGRSSKTARKNKAPVVRQRSIPWATITAVAIVVLFAGGVLGYVLLQSQEKDERAGALATFTPSQSNQDPAKNIQGVTLAPFPAGMHIGPTERVAYTHSPPFGGAHDFSWAACTGVVYPNPVRNENMVHSMEHGAVWIAYDPARISGEPLQALRNRVSGQPYTMLSPYPGLDQPISLQSWGHQLKVSDVNDPRIDQFIHALRRNQYTYPEVGASCAALGPGQFDQDNPPPFDASPPPPGAAPEAGRPGGAAPDEQIQNLTPGGAG